MKLAQVTIEVEIDTGQSEPGPSDSWRRVRLALLAARSSRRARLLADRHLPALTGEHPRPLRQDEQT